jgi:hypothetical protein
MCKLQNKNTVSAYDYDNISEVLHILQLLQYERLQIEEQMSSCQML